VLVGFDLHRSDLLDYAAADLNFSRLWSRCSASGQGENHDRCGNLMQDASHRLPSFLSSLPEFWKPMIIVRARSPVR